MSDESDKYIFSLGDEAAKFAEENLNETEETRQAGLTEIKQWLQVTSPHLNARLEDKYLLPFLRSCKFNLDKTKKKLTNFYTMRRNVPEWFRNRNPQLSELQELVKLGTCVPLKLRYENRLVVIIRAAAHDPQIHKQSDVFKLNHMLIEVALMENELTQLHGVTAIFDLAGITFGHAKELTPSVIKKTVWSWQNYHSSPKQFEIVNAPISVNLVLNVFKSFMTAKMRKRLRVHFGTESLYEKIDKSILPEEYGGNGESIANLIEYWNEKLLWHQEWFAQDEKYFADFEN